MKLIAVGLLIGTVAGFGAQQDKVENLKSELERQEIELARRERNLRAEIAKILFFSGRAHELQFQWGEALARHGRACWEFQYQDSCDLLPDLLRIWIEEIRRREK